MRPIGPVLAPLSRRASRQAARDDEPAPAPPHLARPGRLTDGRADGAAERTRGEGTEVPARRLASVVTIVLMLTVALVGSDLAAPADARALADRPIVALDPGLARYLASYGTRVGVRVLDLQTGSSYVSNAGSSFITASSVKVWLMCALIEHHEAQGIELSTYDRSRLSAMIRRSDNVAASTIYQELGRAVPLAAFARRHGIAGIVPNQRTWSFTLITPRAMTELLRQLANGRLLSAAHRRYALALMRTVIASQRFGVGDTAPAGATVALKNGWVPAADGRWAVNSSGIVTVGARSYVVSVYTRSNGSYGGGVGIVRQVAGAVAHAMGPDAF